VESVERQGAPPRAGLTGFHGSVDGATPAIPAGDDDTPDRPDPLEGPIGLETPHVVPHDQYSFRLVAARVLYDRGAAVAAAAALAALVETSPLRVHPLDLDELGVPPGGSVRVRTDRLSTVLSVVADDTLPRRVVAADCNVPLDEGTVADLVDVSVPVTELRMESL
jgi:anaerobic selenocysteine-containing dehydrogenase